MTLPSITPQPGKVIFVGAGPGNPDLLTIRARQVMERNSIALVEPDVLEGVRNVLAAACAVPQEKIDAAEAQLDWSTRIFQDRQQSLTYVCETPVILEQRAFALGRAIAAHLPD